MKSNNLVSKSNRLIEARYALTTNEQRLLLGALSTIDSRKPMPKEITLHASDFAETFNLPMHKAYEALEEAATKLYSRDIQTYDGQYKERFRWVDKVKYHTGKGAVTLSFTRWVEPYITKLHGNFTRYRMKYVASLRSVYSIRLFEMLIQYKDIGVLVVGVDKFKEQLELADKYSRFSNLRARVINPAIKELEANSGMNIVFNPVKEGRNIVQLKFRFKMSDQLALDF